LQSYLLVECVHVLFCHLDGLRLHLLLFEKRE
jgi:hypothetical protein